jgi:nicotinamidase-related amidase
MTTSPTPTTALLVIDVQEEYFSGSLPIEFPPRTESLANIAAAIDRANATRVPVLLVRHSEPDGDDSFQRDTSAWQLRPEVADRPHDALIDKTLPGTFTGTELGDVLAARGVQHLTIVGYMTNFCCDTTARQALHLGMGVTILTDAVGVPSMPAVGGGMVDASTLHRAALAPLALMGVEMVDTADWQPAGSGS